MHIGSKDVELEVGGLRVEEIKSLVSKTNPLILELGANVGQSTKEFLQWMPGAKIFCFEPDPRAIKEFKENIQSDHVVLTESAVGNFNGKVLFHQSTGEGSLNDWNQSGSIRLPTEHLVTWPDVKFKETIEVPIVRLDDWAVDKKLGVIDFIWADVQGAEGDLILGGSDTLKNAKFFYTEYGALEWYQGQVSLDEICESLFKLGFILYRKWWADALFINKNHNDLRSFEFKISSNKICPCGSLLAYKSCHMKNVSDLTLAVTTHGDLVKVESRIKQIARVAKSIDAKLIISDNAGNTRKTESLKKEYADSYYVSTGLEASENYRFALSKCSTRFMGHLHDDDWVFELDGMLPKHVPAEYIGICPVIVLSSAAQGVYGFRNFDLCQDDPIARISAYVSQSEGAANSLEFAIWETGLIRNIDNVIKFHPCQAGYQDWSIRKAMLAEGKVLSFDKFGYKYNNNNWFGPGTAILQEIESLLRRCQLPVILAKHMNELTFIDLICLFGRHEGYRLSQGHRRVILDSLLSSMVTEYKPEELGSYLGQLLEFIRKIDSETGDRYQTYVEKAINPRPMETQS